MTKHEPQEIDSYHEHRPVLLKEAVSHLITDRDGVYVDGTLGGGGHALEILSRLTKDATLYGIDQDDEALEAAKARIKDDPRFIPVKGNFGYLSRLLPPSTRGGISGLLLDLGVSTHQITEADRGFSFQQEGPLDMRMSNLRGVTAHQVVNEYGYEDLRDIIFHFGVERKRREIARAIIDRRPIESTTELREVVESVVH
ncbi:MAG: 16S rRNA (cytosine(1402)-N(4))-methyltransferase RsmH, partial [Balneolaceae bacterium]|nr:16S rRNA (cytosine(1402)-N(4))-methyltransferase RsmH [Balneolaceae bacterium]